MQWSFEYQFEWDPVKAKKNSRKHGITFDRASTVFSDSYALSQFDDEHDPEEDRWVTLGLDRNGSLLVVCHTYKAEGDRSAHVRIFLARKATKSELRHYEER